MIRSVLRLFSIFALALLAASVATGGTLTGTVRNGTTGSLAPGVEVVLIQLQGGMETVASARADAQGRYRLEHPGLGRQPMLVRVNYRGVNFHQSVRPGRDSADVEVFEPTADASAVKVASRVIVLQPNGPTLLVGEEYRIENQLKPPAAFFKADGNFEFQLPEGAELANVSAWGPSGMPVVQGTMDRGNRRYAIAFAFRPGESGVRLSYQMPYASNQAVLRVMSPYAAQRLFVVAPPTLQITSAGLQPAGSEQGMNLYARESVPAGALFDITVSGTAPPPSSAGDDQGEGQGRAAPSVQTLPARLDSLKWLLVIGLAALFALGTAFLWRRPVSAGVPQKPAGKGTSRAAEEIERDISASLDQLKDTLFRLELRRQAGTISEEEYAREHGRAEKVLRDLVKG